MSTLSKRSTGSCCRELYISLAHSSLICHRRYYKQQGYNTIVMGASFRTLGEIQELAGIDFLTISTGLLDQLKNGSDKYEKKLDVATAKKEQALPKVSFINDEPSFRWSLLEDSMAFDKLHEGIKKFADDAVTVSINFSIFDILRCYSCIFGLSTAQGHP